MSNEVAKTQGTQLIEELEKYFNRYAALSPGLPLVLALWTVATHLFDIFDAFPYLAIMVTHKAMR